MVELVVVDMPTWKRFMDGMGRSNIGPFAQRNRVEGPHAIREYLNIDQVVGRLTVYDANTRLAGHLCRRTYEVDRACMAATQHIYVPTDAEWEAWDEESILADYDITGQKIAALEAERKRNL